MWPSYLLYDLILEIAQVAELNKYQLLEAIQSVSRLKEAEIQLSRHLKVGPKLNLRLKNENLHYLLLLVIFILIVFNDTAR